MTNETQLIIKNYATDLALQMGIPLTGVTLVDGKDVGCRDTHLVHMVSNGKQASSLVYQSELTAMQEGKHSDRLEIKIRAALSRLKMMLEP